MSPCILLLLFLLLVVGAAAVAYFFLDVDESVLEDLIEVTKIMLLLLLP